jgi:choline transport protein
MSELVVQMYAVFHPDLVIQAWHIFVAFVCICWGCITVTIFGNRYLPALETFGLFMVIVGGIVTIIVVAAMPQAHASNSFVWSDWTNDTGWPSGLAFLTGVLNGAFTIGTPDAVTHMAEELPDPKRELPLAVAAQITLGTLSEYSVLHTPSHETDQISSLFSLRYCNPLWDQRSQRGSQQQWIFPLGRGLCPSDR